MTLSRHRYKYIPQISIGIELVALARGREGSGGVGEVVRALVGSWGHWWGGGSWELGVEGGQEGSCRVGEVLVRWRGWAWVHLGLGLCLFSTANLRLQGFVVEYTSDHSYWKFQNDLLPKHLVFPKAESPPSLNILSAIDHFWVTLFHQNKNSTELM